VYKKCIEGIRSSDVVVAVLDGPDADSGTCFEVGYAKALGKPVIGIRTDTRPSQEKGVNAMLSQGCDSMIVGPSGVLISKLKEEFDLLKKCI
jgi:nucleoside 2-deoxyribosyltransferase